MKKDITGYVALVFIGLTLLFLIGSVVLLVTNRPLYCKIAMMGQINSVPAFCLQDAVKDIIGK